MNKGFCRVYQACMKIGMYILPWTTPELLEGAEASRSLAEDIKSRGIDRVLVVTGPNMMKRGLPLPMLDAMERAGIAYEVFDQLTADPTDEQVEKGVRRYYRLWEQEKGASGESGASCPQPGIVLFGGGSPMDCGKAIAARIARPNKTVAQLQGVLKVRAGKKIPFMWAVPTTSGTGSEATMAAVITDHETHRKQSINDISLIPHVCVLDPALTVGLPPSITADTGMDALCHAVEAFTNGTYNTEKEDHMAKEAVRLIYHNLYRAYEDGSDLEARSNMQKAAFYAGRAFTRGCVGYVHALGHTVGGMYGVSHGRAMAVLLPHVMRRYGKAVESKLAELAQICGIAEGDKPTKAAQAFLFWMEDINRKMGIPAGFDCIREEDIPQMAVWADKEANPLYPVPEVLSRRQLAELLRSCRL